MKAVDTSIHIHNYIAVGIKWSIQNDFSHNVINLPSSFPAAALMYSKGILMLLWFEVVVFTKSSLSGNLESASSLLIRTLSALKAIDKEK